MLWVAGIVDVVLMVDAFGGLTSGSYGGFVAGIAGLRIGGAN
jgi:hypothetical protein